MMGFLENRDLLGRKRELRSLKIVSYHLTKSHQNSRKWVKNG